MLQLYNCAVCCTPSPPLAQEMKRESVGAAWSLEPGHCLERCHGTVRHWTLDQLFAATTYTVYTGDVYV